ncbi:MAG: hypothetical protein MUE60_15365 [Candidatus Eisenbacteria bacterium]|nr:hypothetical protein [Candidatus Eisenbacteria bacterium]
MKLSAVILAVMAGGALAAPARERTFATYGDWARGTASGIEVWSPGGVSRAGRLDSVEVADEQYVWDLCPDRDGGVLLGTGGGGRVYRHDGDSLHLVFDSPESDILCVLQERDGTVWAGSSPDGLVYRIGPRGTPVEEFVTGQQAVWSLALRGGEAVVGTGPEGRLFACRSGKPPRELARTAMTNVLSVLALAGEEILAAGDAPCAVQRIGADGSVMTVARLDFDEIRSLTLFGPDSIGALAMGTLASGLPGSALLAGRVSGPLSELWVCPDSLALDLTPRPEGAVVVGGWPGRVHLVKDAGAFRRLAEVSTEQLLCTAASGSRLYLGAGSPACLYWIDEERVTVGSWRSPVIDAGTVAQWGRIAWMGRGGDMTLKGRSGNLGDPDSEWSPWVTGNASDAAWTCLLPDARFAQFELTLRSGDGIIPVVDWLQTNYQPRNREPSITSFNLLARGQKPAGVVGRPPSASPSRGGDPPDDDGDRYLVWTASDPDDDPLEYTVEVSAYPTGEWIGLERAGESYRVVAQGALAEGWYRFRLTATDSPGNPPAVSRRTADVIGPHMIDDTPR